MKVLMSIATLLTALAFQAPSDPPMKMGLWESTGTSTMKQTDGADKTTSHTVRSCVTRENWTTLMGPTAKGSCPKTNEKWTRDQYSFDLACGEKPRMATATIHFDAPESRHGTIDIFALPSGAPMRLHGEFTEHWVSSDCGDVAPEHPVFVH